MKYVVEINGVIDSLKDFERYHYTYVGKEVVIYLSNGVARIEATRKTTYSYHKIVSGKAVVFADAIKKAMLLHYLLYSRKLTMNKLIIQRGKNKKEYLSHEPDFNAIYSLGAEELNPLFPIEWKDEETLLTIISTKKEDQDARFSALVALICAKSTEYEAERFIHLWMSFNGMYGYFSKLVKDKGRPQEKEQLRWILTAQTWGTEHLESKYSNRIGLQITKLLKQYKSEKINWKYLNYDPVGIQLGKDIIKAIEEILGKKYDTSAYGYLLVDYAYYFRCNLIHANKPLPLFSYANEHELKCLRMVNRLLEDYLENNLCLWFKSSYIDKEIKPLANKIASEL